MWRRWRPPKLYKPHPAWERRELLYQARLKRLAEIAEAQQAQEDAYWERVDQYEAWVDDLYDSLPYFLHKLDLSRWRKSVERKDERPRDIVDYVRIAGYYWDWEAAYFNIDTGDLPGKVYISDFLNPDVANTLSHNCRSPVTIENNSYGQKDRPGLWIVVDAVGGRGQIPPKVTYAQMMKTIPADPLSVPVGVGRNGKRYYFNIKDVRNGLIAGTQGGGKSNMINVLISTLITRNSPEDLRLFLIDPKVVEFIFYDRIKHLGGDVRYYGQSEFEETDDGDGEDEEEVKPKKKRRQQIVTVGKDWKGTRTLKKPLGRKILGKKPNEIITVLDYMIAEMERRMALIAGKVRNINAWNKRYPKQKLSHWMGIFDEFAALMLGDRAIEKAVFERAATITQQGRALGIYLWFGTQTPNTKVLPTLVAANCMARFAFWCATGAQSASILSGKHTAATELLPHPGRCIYSEGRKFTEVQTALISHGQVDNAVKVARGFEQQADVVKFPNINPDELWRYALDVYGGYISERDCYPHFEKQGVSREEFRKLVRSYQVRHKGEDFYPQIEIDDQVYVLTPSDRHIARKLTLLDQFRAEYLTKWRKIMERGARRAGKKPAKVAGQFLNLEMPAEPNKPDQQLAQNTENDDVNYTKNGNLHNDDGLNGLNGHGAGTDSMNGLAPESAGFAMNGDGFGADSPPWDTETNSRESAPNPPLPNDPEERFETLVIRLLSQEKKPTQADIRKVLRENGITGGNGKLNQKIKAIKDKYGL